MIAFFWEKEFFFTNKYYRGKDELIHLDDDVSGIFGGYIFYY